jgi:hypothetical protein
MSKLMRRRLAFCFATGLLLVGLAMPVKASYSPAALKQCLWTPPPELNLQLKPELPVQVKARNRDYILVRYRADKGKTIFGYGVIEVAASKRCWNPSAEPSFDVDTMLKRLPLQVASQFKQTLRQDQVSMDKQHLESMRQGYPGVPDKTLREWMKGDGGPSPL